MTVCAHADHVQAFLLFSDRFMNNYLFSRSEEIKDYPRFVEAEGKSYG
jgi:hypothetical protein